MKATFCSSSANCWVPIANGLGKARSSVLIQAYTMSPKFVDMLRQPLQAGADIFLLISDRPIYAPVVLKHLATLARAWPGKLGIRAYGTEERLAHQKSIVIDGTFLLTGSYNFTVSDFFNAVVAVTEKAVVQAHTARFWRIWHSACALPQWTVPSPRGLPPIPAPSQDGTCFMPEGACVGRLLHLINKASRDIRIAVVHLSNPQLIQALLNAAKRGVRVRILHGQSNPVHPKTFRKLWTQLPVRQNEKLHHKFLTVDGTWVSFGSFNFSHGGATNYENIVVVRDPVLASQFDEEWARIWDLTPQVDFFFF